jgi:hypothetical protein
MAMVKRSPNRTANWDLAMDHSRRHDPLLLGTVQYQEKKFCGGVVTGEMASGSDRPPEFGIQSLGGSITFSAPGAPDHGALRMNRFDPFRRATPSTTLLSPVRLIKIRTAELARLLISSRALASAAGSVGNSSAWRVPAVICPSVEIDVSIYEIR